MRQKSRLQKLEQQQPEKPITIKVCWTDEDLQEAEAEAERNGEQLIVIRYVDDWPPDKQTIT